METKKLTLRDAGITLCLFAIFGVIISLANAVAPELVGELAFATIAFCIGTIVQLF
jgi:hypothetical protein